MMKSEFSDFTKAGTLSTNWFGQSSPTSSSPALFGGPRNGAHPRIGWHGRIFILSGILGQRGCAGMGGADVQSLVATKNWHDARSAARYAHAVAREEWDRVERLPKLGNIRGVAGNGEYSGSGGQ
jgi:hypothetical protein